MTTYYPQGRSEKPVKLTVVGVTKYLETVAKPHAASYVGANGSATRRANSQEREMGWDNTDVIEAHWAAAREVTRLEAVIAVIESGEDELPEALYP